MGYNKREKPERGEAPKRSAKDEAMRYLEFRARTEEEIRRHLNEKEYSEEEQRDCLAFLIECHFIDDRDYCFRYIEYAMEKGRGPLRIRQELSQKGIVGELAEEGLAEMYGADAQRRTALRQAYKALSLKGEGAPERRLTEKELAKAARRLAGQGFSSSTVYDVLGKLRRNDLVEDV